MARIAITGVLAHGSQGPHTGWRPAAATRPTDCTAAGRSSRIGTMPPDWPERPGARPALFVGPILTSASLGRYAMKAATSSVISRPGRRKLRRRAPSRRTAVTCFSGPPTAATPPAADCAGPGDVAGLPRGIARCRRRAPPRGRQAGRAAAATTGAEPASACTRLRAGRGSPRFLGLVSSSPTSATRIRRPVLAAGTNSAGPYREETIDTMRPGAVRAARGSGRHVLQPSTTALAGADHQAARGRGPRRSMPAR